MTSRMPCSRAIGPSKRVGHGPPSAIPSSAGSILAALVSNIGSWMQTVVLAAFVFNLTGSSTDVGLMTLAQLGPLFLLARSEAWLADRFDRRTGSDGRHRGTGRRGPGHRLARPMRTTPGSARCSSPLWPAGSDRPSTRPTYSALIPTLVERKDLPGAVSLNSANMNLSRVIGPAIGASSTPRSVRSWVLRRQRRLLSRPHRRPGHRPSARRASAAAQSGWRRLLEGFAVARRDRVVGRCLSTMVLFSFFCLPIAVLMPVLAHNDLGIDANTIAYGLLYAIFGAGAVVGRFPSAPSSPGSRSKRMVRVGLGWLRPHLGRLRPVADSRRPAYPVAFLLGLFYFATVTSLATVLQRRLDDAVRGRVMALWVMAFGGTVPLGAIVAGPLSRRHRHRGGGAWAERWWPPSSAFVTDLHDGVRTGESSAAGDAWIRAGRHHAGTRRTGRSGRPGPPGSRGGRSTTGRPGACCPRCSC